jgi:hypothetical protein
MQSGKHRILHSEIPEVDEIWQATVFWSALLIATVTSNREGLTSSFSTVKLERARPSLNPNV